MKVYTVSGHDGHYLGGYSVIRASSEEEARLLLDAELVLQGLKPGDYTIKELPKGPCLVMLFNGDY